eukprot:4679934-Amphidinium_carterae.1
MLLEQDACHGAWNSSRPSRKTSKRRSDAQTGEHDIIDVTCTPANLKLLMRVSLLHEVFAACLASTCRSTSNTRLARNALETLVRYDSYLSTTVSTKLAYVQVWMPQTIQLVPILESQD